MIGRRVVRGIIVITTSAALGLSCSSTAARKAERDHELQEKLAQMQRDKDASKAVSEALDKEIVAPGQEPPRNERKVGALKRGEPIWIQSGKSRIIQLSGRIDRVAIADPSLAGIVVVGPRSIEINAKALPETHEQVQGLRQAGFGLYLGRTLTPEPHLAETTITIWGEDGLDIHTLVIAGFIDEQVLLDVTVAEVNRTAMEEHGIDWRVVQNDAIAAGFMMGGIPPQTLTTVPPQQGQPLLPLTAGSAAPNYALIFPNQDLTVFLKILQTEGLATVLAQPNILAMSGQTAVFQVGGEIPIRISTAFTTDVEFKPFGTLVNFVPRVSDEGDILLTVTPEVSEPDFTQTVEGIPSFITRRASTSVKLRNGQTLVVGGLLQTKRVEQVAGLPYLKDIPYLGYLFRTTTYSKVVTELLIVVTPKLVHPIAPGEEIPLPSDRGPMTPEEARTKPEAATLTRPRLPGLH